MHNRITQEIPQTIPVSRCAPAPPPLRGLGGRGLYTRSDCCPATMSRASVRKTPNGCNWGNFPLHPRESFACPHVLGSSVGITSAWPVAPTEDRPRLELGASPSPMPAPRAALACGKRHNSRPMPKARHPCVTASCPTGNSKPPAFPVVRPLAAQAISCMPRTFRLASCSSDACRPPR